MTTDKREQASCWKGKRGNTRGQWGKKKRIEEEFTAKGEEGTRRKVPRSYDAAFGSFPFPAHWVVDEASTLLIGT